ncbi:MAG: hypothetical protein ACT4P3_06045 [Betaproteobacteria bacterium]
MKLLLLVPLLAPFAVNAQMHECTLNPHDPQVAAKLAEGGGALELRKGSEGCRLVLDCRARAAPARLSYDLATLKGLKAPPVASQITRITFEYADGAPQTSRVIGAARLE